MKMSSSAMTSAQNAELRDFVSNPVQSFIDDAQYLIRKGLNNSVSFIKEFNEFHKSRNCSILQMLSRDLYDELIKVYNQYVLSNGLFIKSWNETKRCL